MGCTSSSSKKTKESDKVLAAALVIQSWYRRYRAQLKTRERFALHIFQSIEYADEQSQLQLSNFFTFVLEHYRHIRAKDLRLVNRLYVSSQHERDIMDDDDDGMLSEISDIYGGPQLQFPLTFADVESLIEGYKQHQLLHACYVLEILFETKKALKQMPNFNLVKTSPSKEVTICGDLHGKLDDLFLIFYKNGLPSENNAYIFNGDFVDRGDNSIEILMILLVSFLVYPNDVHLNRGNHEDFLMNMRYGFSKEVMHKYKLYGKKILQVLEEVYAWLPIGTIIDEEILVIHGGISESTDLNFLHCLSRNKMKSVLMPPIQMHRGYGAEFRKSKGETLQGVRTTRLSFAEEVAQKGWDQVISILWSDPRDKRGCHPNTSRGGGYYFGPDVTAKVLSKFQLKLLIRSHECKPEGYEITHNGKVITVFSASNYYAEGSNRGAYIKLSRGTRPRFFQYQVTEATRSKPLHQRVTTIESSAIRILKERIISRKTDLINAFQLQDRKKSGKLSLGQWAFSMQNVLGLKLAWRSLSSHLVTTDKDGNVDYMSCFSDIHIQKPVKEVQSAVIETLYRYRSDLQIIFDIIDTDHSGLISMEEFNSMWKLFSSHYDVHIDDHQVYELAEKMDLNEDGGIDFNEFFKAFHVVHKFDKLNKSDTNFA
ncbi:serine/threonine-protein phosphatase with EF-hands 1-like isoform X1 [Rhinolophus ferrumequinum]|uniref:serine/threonine-protein phosphatase with EF-hands 1-like isoform X1 n=1 Tax=Rhinolophus ferrumequinum TaxID=59479 RepID=UPI00140F748F|nr:serine/threonine-protein phosphatase with EF-hands 1-like isoform X1 [Rhinolophus ferrumequinum]XP_032984321.1 serine/threonine-protein phosphatase with EF-hands 1-like isoform X1 [Rhinolophus ferrumequinum]XP_032984323.1 serine/threonine-protein phosphatase with EF-hands 1-like isoform X1 [Rhinolophus ferrumequinum]